MRKRYRSISYRGQSFRFERMEEEKTKAAETWAAYRRREFIGMLSCTEPVTTKEFEVRCTRWLSELLG